MPRIPNTTDRQSAFLREFSFHQGTPPPHAWPSRVIVRRWLRHDGFRRAYAYLQRTLKTVRDFQSLTAALATAQTFNDVLRANRAWPTSQQRDRR